MDANPLVTIKELGARFKRRISPTTFYDGNVATWHNRGGKPWDPVITSGESFIRELRFDYQKHRIRIFASSSFLRVEVIGSFPIEPFSLNKENANYPLLKPAGTATIDGQQYAVFTKSGMLAPDQEAIFARDSLKRLVSARGLSSAESLHFSGGGIYVYREYCSTARALDTIKYLVNLAEEIERPTEEPDLDSLPKQFHPLIPLVKKWAIADDGDREHFLESLPNSVLESVVAEVSPFLHSIDSYLDSFGGHPSEAATELGRLAECALEAKRLLQGRT